MKYIIEEGDAKALRAKWKREVVAAIDKLTLRDFQDLANGGAFRLDLAITAKDTWSQTESRMEIAIRRHFSCSWLDAAITCFLLIVGASLIVSALFH